MNVSSSVVVISGADHPTGLGTARALAGIGYHIIGLAYEPGAICCKSNIWDRIVTIGTGEEAILEGLVATGKSLPNRAILIPAQDEVVKVVSDRRDMLEQYFLFNLPPPFVVDLLLYKTSFYPWAQAHGFPVPDSYVARSMEELTDAASRFKGQFLIKPLIRTLQWNRISPDDKVLLLSNPAEVADLKFDFFQAAPEYLLQQWIPGDDSDVFFCLEYFDASGEEVSFFSGRKILQWPPHCGSTAITVSCHNEELHQLAKRIFKTAGFKGLGSLEVKQSRADGKLYITEPTVGRNNLQSFLAVSGGVNLTRQMVDELSGATCQPCKEQRRASFWLHEKSTVRSAKYYLKNRRFPLSMMKLLLGCRPGFAYFSPADVRPFVTLVCNGVKRTFYL